MPPFRYTPNQNRYVGSIADLMGRGNEAEARALIASANAQAQSRPGQRTGVGRGRAGHWEYHRGDTGADAGGGGPQVGAGGPCPQPGGAADEQGLHCRADRVDGRRGQASDYG